MLGGNTLDTFVARFRAAPRDQAYYIRLVTGLLFTTAFFTVGAIVSQKEFSKYGDYVGREGRTFFYASREAILGSAGQGMVEAVFAAVAFVLAITTVARRWRMGIFNGTKALLQISIICAIAGGLAGLFGNGVPQLALGAIGLRFLFWVLLPLLGIGAVAGVAYYAAEGKGTVLDI